MSSHYTNRQSSGCWECMAAIAVTVGTAAAAGYACWRFAAWLAGLSVK